MCKMSLQEKGLWPLRCPHCDLLPGDQKLRLATPAYQKKKEKQESKAMAVESSSTLVDPSLVSVIGLAKDNGVKSSEEASTTPVGAKAKKMDKSLEAVINTPETVTSKKIPDIKVAKEKSSKKRHSSPAKSSKVSADSKLEAMDLKWSERFSCLEAMLLSKSFSQPEPSFQPVKITPMKPLQLGQWTPQNPSLHRPDPPTGRLHLIVRPLTDLGQLTDLLLPTSLPPTQ